MEKWCHQCKENKSHSDFSKDGSRPDGLDKRCRACRKLIDKGRTTYAYRRERFLRYYQNKKDHIKARAAVKKALIDGKIFKGFCAECAAPKVHAHHYKGYAKENWLDIIWLCQTHHTLIHAK